MKKLIAVALLLLSAFIVLGQPIQRNYYTTNAAPIVGGQATNIFVGASGVPTITTNVAGSIYTVNLSAATVGAVTSSNALYALTTTTATNLAFTEQYTAWVSKSGSDTTGTVGKQGSPFLTISNAVFSVKTALGSANTNGAVFVLGRGPRDMYAETWINLQRTNLPGISLVGVGDPWLTATTGNRLTNQGPLVVVGNDSYVGNLSISNDVYAVYLQAAIGYDESRSANVGSTLVVPTNVVIENVFARGNSDCGYFYTATAADHSIRIVNPDWQAKWDACFLNTSGTEGTFDIEGGSIRIYQPDGYTNINAQWLGNARAVYVNDGHFNIRDCWVSAIGGNSATGLVVAVYHAGSFYGPTNDGSNLYAASSGTGANVRDFYEAGTSGRVTGRFMPNMLATNTPFSGAALLATSAGSSRYTRDLSSATNIDFAGFSLATKTAITNAGTGGSQTTITNTASASGLVVGGSGSYGVGTNLTDAATLIAGSNITIATNTAGRVWTITGTGGGATTITNTSSAAGDVVGRKGSYGIGRNPSAAPTNGFFRLSNTPDYWTNVNGDAWALSAGASIIFLGGEAAGKTLLANGVPSYFSDGIFVDERDATGTYSFGKASPGTVVGELVASVGSFSSDLAVTGDLSVAGTFQVDDLIAVSLTATNLYSAKTGNTNAIAYWGSDGNLTNGVTSAQVGGLFTGGNDYLKADGTTGTGGSGGGPTVVNYASAVANMSLGAGGVRYAPIYYNPTAAAGGTTEAAIRMPINLEAPYTLTNFSYYTLGASAQLLGTTNLTFRIYTNGVFSGAVLNVFQGQNTAANIFTNDNTSSVYVAAGGYTNLMSIQISNNIATALGALYIGYQFQVVK